MITIKSDSNEKSLDIRIDGYAPDLVQEFGAIIRNVCQDFITKMVDKDCRKSFASQLAVCYVKEIRAAYKKAIE